MRCRSITRRIRRVPDSGGKPNPADRYWRRIEHCSGGRLSCQSRLPQAVLIFMKRVLVERLGRIRNSTEVEHGLFCLRFVPLTVTNSLDHLWLSFVNRSEFGSCVARRFQKFVKLCVNR